MTLLGSILGRGLAYSVRNKGGGIKDLTPDQVDYIERRIARLDSPQYPLTDAEKARYRAEMTRDELVSALENRYARRLPRTLGHEPVRVHHVLGANNDTVGLYGDLTPRNMTDIPTGKQVAVYGGRAGDGGRFSYANVLAHELGHSIDLGTKLAPWKQSALGRALHRARFEHYQRDIGQHRGTQGALAGMRADLSTLRAETAANRIGLRLLPSSRRGQASRELGEALATYLRPMARRYAGIPVTAVGAGATAYALGRSASPAQSAGKVAPAGITGVAPLNKAIQK